MNSLKDAQRFMEQEHKQQQEILSKHKQTEGNATQILWSVISDLQTQLKIGETKSAEMAYFSLLNEGKAKDL